MNFKEKIEWFARMTDEEFRQLEGDDLWVAAMVRMENAESPDALTHGQLVLLVLTRYDAEVKNGGLCQFFANDGGLVAPYIREYLKTVGAEEHRALFDGFTGKYGIDVNDLSEFSFTTIEEFVELYALYPFDEFDDAYYELPPLSSYLAPVVRENPDEFM